MKIDELPRPGLIALGLAGVAATALLGFAAGMVVARDPEALRRAARGVARGLERATLLAAQAREHVGDLWAEAREAAIAEVDAADFERAAKAAAKPSRSAAAAATAAAAVPAQAAKPVRKRASRPRKARVAKAPAAATERASAGESA